MYGPIDLVSHPQNTEYAIRIHECYSTNLSLLPRDVGSCVVDLQSVYSAKADPSPVLPHGAQSKGGRPAGWWPWRRHRAGTAGAAAWCTRKLMSYVDLSMCIKPSTYLSPQDVASDWMFRMCTAVAHQRWATPTCVRARTKFLFGARVSLPQQRRRKDADKI
jgi:hypothetical protein